MSQSNYDFFLSDRYKWAISLGTGLFFFIFLLVFLPFGVSNFNPNHQYTLEFLTVMGAIMMLTIALLLLCEFAIKPLVIQKATLRSLLLWSVFLMLSAGFGNYLFYNWMGDWHDLSWGSAVQFILNCSSVFLFPFLGIFFYFRHRMMKEQFREMILDLEKSPDITALIHFEGQGKADQFSVANDDFRYAQAQDNYVALFYIKEGVLQTELIRSSLSQLLENTRWKDLVRVHRSFAVNLRAVRSFSAGPSVQLFLKDVQVPIPVSKTYRSNVFKSLKKT